MEYKTLTFAVAQYSRWISVEPVANESVFLLVRHWDGG